MKTYIIVRTQVEGLHNWPAAKDVFPEVAFLSDPHRHIFHIEASCEVTHTDRDREFIMFKRLINSYLKMKYYDNTQQLHVFGSRSCEMIAKDLLEHFNCNYVEVWEDLENCGRVEK
jgi:hypothetical protein